MPRRGSAAASVVRLGEHALPVQPAGDARACRPARAIVAHAAGVWRSLKTLVWHERLAASPTDALFTTYYARARPTSSSYTIRGHSPSVIIGRRRWDRSTPTGRWAAPCRTRRSASRVPFWASVADARVLGSGTVAGRRVWNVTFFDPEHPGVVRGARSTSRPAARSSST